MNQDGTVSVRRTPNNLNSGYMSINWNTIVGDAPVPGSKAGINSDTKFNLIDAGNGKVCIQHPESGKIIQ